MSAPKKIYTGVGLDPEVVDFLADLSQETQRTRSWLINALIRDQARRMSENQEFIAKKIAGNPLPTIQR